MRLACSYFTTTWLAATSLALSVASTSATIIHEPVIPPANSDSINGTHLDILVDKIQAGTTKGFSIFKYGTNVVHDKEYKKKCELLDISKLTGIAFNREGTVYAQSAVKMGDLVTACKAQGVVPAVVPGFKGITVGGAVVGAALDSSSGRYGQFGDVCRSMDVVLGDGRVVTCKPQDCEYSDLYHGLAGSFGSLGVLLGAEIQVVPWKDYVRLSYHVFSSMSDAIEFVRRTCNAQAGTVNPAGMAPPLYVEGMHVVHRNGTSLAVVLCGDLVQNLDGDEDKIVYEQTQKAYGEWFYEHVQDIVWSRKQMGVYVEYLPTYDYLFRFDRGSFWMARPVSRTPSDATLATLLLMAATHRNWISRLLFRWAFTTTRLYQVMGNIPQDLIAKKMVIQDLYVPFHRVPQLVDFVRTTVPVSTPLWFCPVRPPQHQQFLSPHGHTQELLVDVGVRGRVPDRRGVEHSRRLEAWARVHGGRKMLYSQNFYSESAFWKIYDLWQYRKLRKKYSAENIFPDVFTKINSLKEDQPETKATWLHNVISNFAV